MKRYHLHITQEQHEVLRDLWSETGVTPAAQVRKGVDCYLRSLVEDPLIRQLLSESIVERIEEHWGIKPGEVTNGGRKKDISGEHHTCSDAGGAQVCRCSG